MTIAKTDYDRTFDRPTNDLILVNLGPEGAAALAASGTTGLDQFSGHRGAADARSGSTSGWTAINMLLNLLYVLLGLSVVVSLFGMLNALALAVFERTRELGMLRAVGLERRQLRRMIRNESVVIALIGGVTGIGLGLLLAAIVAGALSDEGVSFGVPWGPLIAFTIVAALAGIVASIAPARRAGAPERARGAAV